MFKRAWLFGYGAASYLVFLATFLYATAGCGGSAVSTRLVGPPQTSVPAALAIDGLLLTRRTAAAASASSTGALAAVLKESTRRFMDVLQVWAGKDSPGGTLAEPHRPVSLDAFSGSVQ
jgi:hypothetical protein